MFGAAPVDDGEKAWKSTTSPPYISSFRMTRDPLDAVKSDGASFTPLTYTSRRPAV